MNAEILQLEREVFGIGIGRTFIEELFTENNDEQFERGTGRFYSFKQMDMHRTERLVDLLESEVIDNEDAKYRLACYRHEIQGEKLYRSIERQFEEAGLSELFYKFGIELSGQYDDEGNDILKLACDTGRDLIGHAQELTDRMNEVIPLMYESMKYKNVYMEPGVPAWMRIHSFTVELMATQGSRLSAERGYAAMDECALREERDNNVWYGKLKMKIASITCPALRELF